MTKIKQETMYFWAISGVVACFFLVMGLFIGEVEFLSIHFDWLLFGFLVFYLTISIRSQQPNELGAKLFFGRVIQITRPGPVVAWKGIIHHRIESVSLQNDEFPTDLEKRGIVSPEEAKRKRETDGGDGVDHYRMTHKGVDKNAGTDRDPMGQGRLTTEVTGVLSWKITDIKKFLTNAVNATHFVSQMEDSSATEMRKHFARKTAAETYTEWKEIEDSVQGDLEALIEKFGFGVQIRKFSIKKIDLPHKINSAFSEQVASNISIQTEKNQGEAKKVFDEMVAMGDFALRKAVLDAEAEGFENIARRLGLSDQGAVILQSQVVRDALQKANFNLLSTGGDVLGIVGSIQQALEANKGKTGVKTEGGEK